MSNRIVPAVQNDWKGFWELDKRCFPAVDVFKPRQIRYILNSKTCKSFVIRSGNQIIASIIGLIRGFRIPSGRIYKVAVDQRLRGQGCASKLIRRMEGEFRKCGLRKSCAEVRMSNHASRNLFIKNGYRPVQTLPRYYADGEDGLKFWKSW